MGDNPSMAETAMKDEKQTLRAQQENDFTSWCLGDGKSGGKFPDFDVIRAGKDVFTVPCGPLVKETTVRLMLHVPSDIGCKKTETGFVLVNPQKVN